MDLHRLAEERSLAYHRAVAQRLMRDPSLLERARARVREWLERGEPHPEYARAWDAILARPTSEVVAAIVDEAEPARALRQTTPFAGFISPRERWAIWRDVRRAREAER